MGATNVLFKQKKQLIDVLVEVSIKVILNLIKIKYKRFDL